MVSRLFHLQQFFRSGGAPDGAPPRRRWPAVLRSVGGAVAALSVMLGMAWLGLALHPHPLFAYSLRRANVVLHARAPLPPQVGAMLDEVLRRVSRSPLYDPVPTFDVFLCDTQALFTMFAPDARKVGGVAHTHLGGNVFIRPANVAGNRVIGFSGRATSGERTLTYFITHELTHALTMRHTGRLAYRRLAAFQQEGYADYVAFAHTVDLRDGREALRRDAPEMDTKRSGLYRRQELLVAYLLQREGLTVSQLLATPLDRHEVEGRLEADANL